MEGRRSMASVSFRRRFLGVLGLRGLLKQKDEADCDARWTDQVHWSTPFVAWGITNIAAADSFGGSFFEPLLNAPLLCCGAPGATLKV